MVIDEIVEKLRTLQVFLDTPEQPNSVRENAEIFEKCTSLEDIRKEASKRHWGCGSGQFVYFHLRSLLKDQEYKTEFLEDAKRQLGGLGISLEHIEDYYQSGVDPGCIFTSRYEEQYSLDVRVNFYDKANQFALNKMREWLGFK